MITQVKTYEQLQKAYMAGMQITNKLWANDATITNKDAGRLICCHALFEDITNWQIIEPDLMVPDSVGFVTIHDGIIALKFGDAGKQILWYWDGQYQVSCYYYVNRKQRKLSLHKTTFGEIKVGEWFYCGDGRWDEKSYYYIKTNANEAVYVTGNKWIAGYAHSLDQQVYKLAEVKQ